MRSELCQNGFDDDNVPARYVSVCRAEHLCVVQGANRGDALGFADDLQPGDVYRLATIATLHSLSLMPTAAPPFRIGRGSRTGTPGACLHFDSCLTFMAGDGTMLEGLVLVETEGALATQIFFLPLAEFPSGHNLTLVGISRDTALQRVAQMACASFSRGTSITLASGAQRAVEDLAPGDRVLTRDGGPQPIRRIGHHVARATGSFAPVLIRTGALGNSADLLVSPDHRLFVYQRRDRLGTGRAELLVRARHLVDGRTVLRTEGGFVEYFHMLFDTHEIVYAEGIAAESMLADPHNGAIVPGRRQTGSVRPINLQDAGNFAAFEPPEAMLRRPDIAAELRRSSFC